MTADQCNIEPWLLWGFMLRVQCDPDLFDDPEDDADGQKLKAAISQPTEKILNC